MVKQMNGEVDYIPDQGFDGQELIPGISDVIMAERGKTILMLHEQSHYVY